MPKKRIALLAAVVAAVAAVRVWRTRRAERKLATYYQDQYRSSDTESSDS